MKVLRGDVDDRESPLHIHLGQVMSRGEKMEFTIQKSIELGVSLITPLFSERCGVKLDAERLNKKIQQWQNCHCGLRTERPQSYPGDPPGDGSGGLVCRRGKRA